MTQNKAPVYSGFKIDKAAAIKVSAVITSSPRWVIALLAAEGFTLPESWRPWWIILSSFLSLGMAVVEGFAFSYMLTAWRNQRDKMSDKILWMAITSAIIFIIVMFPSVSAGVRGETLNELFSRDVFLHLWSIAVAASTIVIVAGVGYAEKGTEVTKTQADERLKKENEELKARLNENEKGFHREREEMNAKLKGTESRLNESENQRKQIEDGVKGLLGLLSEVKKEQIITIKMRWPFLTQAIIAEMVGTSISHVSTILKKEGMNPSLLPSGNEHSFPEYEGNHHEEN